MRFGRREMGLVGNCGRLIALDALAGETLLGNIYLLRFNQLSILKLVIT